MQLDARKHKLTIDSEEDTDVSRKKANLEKVRNATPQDVIRWQRHVETANKTLTKLGDQLKVATAPENKKKTRESMAELAKRRDGHEMSLQLYSQYSRNYPPITPTSTDSTSGTQSPNPVDNKGVPMIMDTRNKVPPAGTSIHGTSLSVLQEQISHAQKNGCTADNAHSKTAIATKAIANSSRLRQLPFHSQTTEEPISTSPPQQTPTYNSTREENIERNFPLCLYGGNRLWIRRGSAVDILMGVDGQRRAQLEHETNTRIQIRSSRQRPPNRKILGYYLCRVTGKRKNITESITLIRKLLSGTEAGKLEAQRLDVAAQDSLSQYTTSHKRDTEDVFERPANHRGISLLGHQSGRKECDQSLENKKSASITLQEHGFKIPYPQRTNLLELSNTGPRISPPKVTPKLIRFVLTESEEETSSSSSDDESASSSDGDPQPEFSKTVHALPLPAANNSMSLPAGRTEPSSTELVHVIKIQDDSEDESPLMLQSPETYRRDNNLGTAPTIGTLRVSEVKRMLDLRDAMAAHLSQKVKILEYALHYKGVTDFQITRMRAQVGEKGSWNAKFADILGEPRKGNERDGGPLTAAERRRIQK